MHIYCYFYHFVLPFLAIFGTFPVILALLFCIRALITPKTSQLCPDATFKCEKVFTKFKKSLRDNFKQFNIFKNAFLGNFSAHFQIFWGGAPLTLCALGFSLPSEPGGGRVRPDPKRKIVIVAQKKPPTHKLG